MLRPVHGGLYCKAKKYKLFHRQWEVLELFLTTKMMLPKLYSCIMNLPFMQTTEMVKGKK